MRRALQRVLTGLFGKRSSLTRQTSLTFALISFLVLATAGLAIDRMLAHELMEANDVLLLGNMTLVANRLARLDRPESILTDPGFVEDTGMGYRRLGLAVLDENRRVLQASEDFNVPVSALPPAALPIELLPDRVDAAAERRLLERFGHLTREWVAPDGRWYQVLLGRLALYASPETNAPPRTVLIALSYERSLPRELLGRYRKGLIEALIASVLAAAALGVWATHLVLMRAKRVAATAARISAHGTNERLVMDDVPEEFRDSAAGFNQMLDRLEDSFRRLSEFSSDLAHDLRTPINNLLGEAQVALSRPRDAGEYRAVLESAVEEYERLSRMIENMLFLARADSAQARLAPRWVDLRHALEKIVSYYEVLAEERNIRVALEVRSERAGRPRAWADELMLNRAIGNLLSNALRHSPEGSTIEVRAVARADGTADIAVANPGAGIAAEHLPRIFDRFYRPCTAREDSATGSGLGLAIVKSIAELHGGRVAVESAPGTRTVFSLSFPAAG